MEIRDYIVVYRPPAECPAQVDAQAVREEYGIYTRNLKGRVLWAWLRVAALDEQDALDTAGEELRRAGVAHPGGGYTPHMRPYAPMYRDSHAPYAPDSPELVYTYTPGGLRVLCVTSTEQATAIKREHTDVGSCLLPAGTAAQFAELRALSDGEIEEAARMASRR